MTPVVTELRPEGSNFAHVVEALQPAAAPERIGRGAAITEVLFPNGSPALGSRADETGLVPLLVMREFYIRPGRYRLRYVCASWKVEVPLYVEHYFAPNSNYEFSCRPDLPRLVIRPRA